jgi:8-oxo-dGTP pyrophosphatase MutT (NUDIX family)
VLRPGASGRDPFEVLLVRRNAAMTFMGGAYVFPGGRVDETDAAVPAEACDGLDTAARCDDLSRGEEAAYRVAAIRELLEEAGVLLARADGAIADAATATMLRASLPAPVGFVPHLAGYGLRIALDAVVPFAHWVTPEFEPRRYDTRFLMACVPASQDASHDAGETTALEWIRPGDAIARNLERTMVLPVPTWAVLSRLARFQTVAEAWAWASTTPIVRIQPKFADAGGAVTLMLPGDPTYPLPPGCEPFEHTRFRFLAGGYWRPEPL